MRWQQKSQSLKDIMSVTAPPLSQIREQEKFWPWSEAEIILMKRSTVMLILPLLFASPDHQLNLSIMLLGLSKVTRRQLPLSTNKLASQIPALLPIVPL